MAINDHQLMDNNGNWDANDNGQFKNDGQQLLMVDEWQSLVKTPSSNDFDDL